MGYTSTYSRRHDDPTPADAPSEVNRVVRAVVWLAVFATAVAAFWISKH
jgi:hypothetical protein